VGSGSFKDVYMGRYRNFRVAICDLRGRLTDMDIKELGLLRDLRSVISVELELQGGKMLTPEIFNRHAGILTLSGSLGYRSEAPSPVPSSLNSVETETYTS
jgi:hypothetical protein